MPHDPPRKETKPRGFPPSFSALGARTPDEERARVNGAKAEVERLSRALALAERHVKELEADRARLIQRAAHAEAKAVGAQRERARVLLRAENVLKTQLRGVVPGADRYRMWDYVRGAGPPAFRVRNNRDARALDATLRALPSVDAFLDKTGEGKFIDEDGCYRVVVPDGQTDYVKFVCANQGYADVVEEDDAQDLVEAILDAAPDAPSDRLLKIFGCPNCVDEHCGFGRPARARRVVECRRYRR